MGALVAVIAAILLPFVVRADGQAIPEPTVRVGAQFLSDSGNSLLAVNFENHPGWHTYWKNPGAAGRPLKVELEEEGKPIHLPALAWPAPKKFVEAGDITTYGYDGSYTLFFRFNPQDWEGKTLNFSASWLACKHLCVPGKMASSIKIRKGILQGASFTLGKLDQAVLARRLASLPGPGRLPPGIDFALEARQKGGLTLYYSLASAKLAAQFLPEDNLLIPFPHKLIGFKPEQIFSDESGRLYGKMGLDWLGEYSQPEVSLPKDGRFLPPLTLTFLYFDPMSVKVSVIKREFSQIGSAGKNMAEFYSLLNPITPKSGPSWKSKRKGTTDAIALIEERGILLYLLFAFLGGIILNIMPCVLPVIGLKLFGLLSVREKTPRSILKHNLFYTLGVLATFAALGALIVGLKSAGESVGWGFHLQSPHFVVGMIIVLTILTLNLFGLFEFQVLGGKALGGLDFRRGIAGDFFSGVLATTLSTPCSAPFLGTALTFAFSSSSATLFLVFQFIGLGMALPFILTAFVPRLISLLPKPGMWMEKFKKFLSLPLILSIIWLLDVLNGLAGDNSVIFKIHLGLALLFFAFYLKKNITPNKYWHVVAFMLPVLFLGDILFSPIPTGTGPVNTLMRKNSGGLTWERWSVEKMREYRDKRQAVFISFTADWCLTCKANEQLVIHTPMFKQMIEDYDVKLLLADWTRPDEFISDFLKDNDLVGIPAYFVQKPDGSLINLRETITIGKIKKHLK